MIAAGVGVAWLGYRLRVVTIPLLLAMLLAYLVEPLVRRVVGRGWMSRRGAALSLLSLAVLLIVIPVMGGVTLAVAQGVDIAASIARRTGVLIHIVQATEAEEQAEAIRSLRGAWRWAGEHLRDLRQEAERYAQRGAENDALPPWKFRFYQGIEGGLRWVRDNAEVVAQSVGQWAVGGGVQAVGALARTLASAGMMVLGAMLTAFFFYFFCTGWGRVLEFWDGLIPDRRRVRVVELLRRMDVVIAGFVRGRLTIAAILSLYMVGAYWFIGVPTPVLLGVTVGMLLLLPMVHIVGVPVAMLLMALDGSGWEWQRHWWWIVISPIGVYLVAQVLDDYVLTPAIQGPVTGLDVPMIVVASIAGGTLAGMYGLLLAIPAAACLKIVLQEVFWPRVERWVRGEERDVLPIE